MWQLWWIPKDRSSRELMDEYPDRESARAAIPECRAALKEQGMSEKDINAGSWKITKKEE